MVRKKKFLSLVLMILSSFCICLGIGYVCKEAITASRAPKKENVSRGTARPQMLFIGSYSATYYPTDAVKRGIGDALRPKGMRFDSEYMDTRKYDVNISTDLFYKSLKYKLENREPYKAVILGGDNALKFALEHQNELFKNVPLVFFDVHDIDLAIEANKTPFVTGEFEKYSVSDTIDFAISLYPKATSITAIHDGTIMGKGDMMQFLALQKYYPNFSLKTLNVSEISSEQFAQRLHALGESDILIFLTTSKNSKGIFYSADYISDFIKKNVSIPVFSTFEECIKTGFFGGAVFDFYNAGKNAAQSALDVISGEKVASNPVDFSASTCLYLNYDEIKRFRIDLKKIPNKNVVIFNQPDSYWEKNKKSLYPVIMILVSFTIIIFLTGYQYKSKKSYAYELQKSRRKLLYSSRHDFLTGLANRHYAHEVLEELQKSKKEFSLFLIDVDNFKSINDFFSHSCGDSVLREVARRLEKIAENRDYFVSRYGGDEFFVIYKKGILTAEDTEIVEFKKALDGEFITDSKRIIIRTSIGVATSANVYSEDDDIISFADFALYTAKKNGRNMTAFFDAKMSDEIKKQKKLAEIVENACQNEAFVVLYQPQMSAKTKQIQGYEALVRLKDSYISPADFIPVAEKNGFIGKIGRIVTKKVVQQIVKWREEKLPLYTVSINYSSGQMGDVEYVQYLHNLLQENEINPQLIKIEITESLCMKNTRQAMHLFESFSQIGVKLALDDFGTGFSSLSYLTYLPVDTVKIDKTMTDTYLVDGKDDFIENIISLVHSLGMKLTAEGVEQQWQYDKLKEFQCDSIQGYFFSRPISGEVVCESLHDGRF